MRQHTPAEWVTFNKGNGREAGGFGCQGQTADTGEEVKVVQHGVNTARSGSSRSICGSPNVPATHS